MSKYSYCENKHLTIIQQSLFDEIPHVDVQPFRTQLLKWIGNKQRFANEIVGVFPLAYNRYFEPFLGSGGVLATLAPKNALASDAFSPLIEIWLALKNNPEKLTQWYEERWKIAHGESKRERYESIKASFNKQPNGADFLFLCRSCYGGAVRFRKEDGYMSTPCGVHEPIKPSSFKHRVDLWHSRLKHADFCLLDYKDAMNKAKEGDLIYCDPPYVHSQDIIYGGQNFKLQELLEMIHDCKARGVFVVLSIDGTKKIWKIFMRPLNPRWFI